MDLPMRDDLKIGNKFPDFELPDYTGTKRRLSQLLRGFPGALIFDRGHF
jgi:peroxiredoxin